MRLIQTKLTGRNTSCGRITVVHAFTLCLLRDVLFTVKAHPAAVAASVASHRPLQPGSSPALAGSVFRRSIRLITLSDCLANRSYIFSCLSKRA